MPAIVETAVEQGVPGLPRMSPPGASRASVATQGPVKARLEAMQQQRAARQGCGGQTYPPAEASHEAVFADRALFQRTLESLLTSLGIRLKIPKVGGQEVDLHRLYQEVTSLGGLHNVIARKQWVVVCDPFNFPASFTNKSFVIRKLYVNVLHHYEQVYFHRTAGPIIPPPLGTGLGGEQMFAHKSSGDGMESTPSHGGSSPPGKRRPAGVGAIASFVGLMNGTSASSLPPPGRAPAGASGAGPGTKPQAPAASTPPPPAASPSGSSNTATTAPGGHPGTSIAPPQLAIPGLAAGTHFGGTIDYVLDYGYLITLHLPGQQLCGMLYKKLPDRTQLMPNVLPHQAVYQNGAPVPLPPHPLAHGMPPPPPHPHYPPPTTLPPSLHPHPPPGPPGSFGLVGSPSAGLRQGSSPRMTGLPPPHMGSGANGMHDSPGLTGLLRHTSPRGQYTGSIGMGQGLKREAEAGVGAGGRMGGGGGGMVGEGEDVLLHGLPLGEESAIQHVFDECEPEGPGESDVVKRMRLRSNGGGVAVIHAGAHTPQAAALHEGGGRLSMPGAGGTPASVNKRPSPGGNGGQPAPPLPEPPRTALAIYTASLDPAQLAAAAAACSGGSESGVRGGAGTGGTSDAGSDVPSGQGVHVQPGSGGTGGTGASSTPGSQQLAGGAEVAGMDGPSKAAAALWAGLSVEQRAMYEEMEAQDTARFRAQLSEYERWTAAQGTQARGAYNGNPSTERTLAPGAGGLLAGGGGGGGGGGAMGAAGPRARAHSVNSTTTATAHEQGGMGEGAGGGNGGGGDDQPLPLLPQGSVPLMVSPPHHGAHGAGRLYAQHSAPLPHHGMQQQQQRQHRSSREVHPMVPAHPHGGHVRYAHGPQPHGMYPMAHAGTSSSSHYASLPLLSGEQDTDMYGGGMQSGYASGHMLYPPPPPGHHAQGLPPPPPPMLRSHSYTLPPPPRMHGGHEGAWGSHHHAGPPPGMVPQGSGHVPPDFVTGWVTEGVRGHQGIAHARSGHRRPQDSVAMMSQGLPLMPIPHDESEDALVHHPHHPGSGYNGSGGPPYTSARTPRHEAPQMHEMEGGMTGAEAAAAFAADTHVRPTTTTPAPQLSGLDGAVGAGDDVDVCALALSEDINGPMLHMNGPLTASPSQLPHGYTDDELAAIHDLSDVPDGVDASRAGSPP